jgi:hypothetical protein
MQENMEPIGGPEPMPSGEARNIFDVVVCALTVGFGSVVALLFLAAPARVSGATRSARLQVQQREAEIQEAIVRSEPAEPTKVASESSGSSDVNEGGQ